MSDKERIENLEREVEHLKDELAKLRKDLTVRTSEVSKKLYRNIAEQIAIETRGRGGR